MDTNKKRSIGVWPMVMLRKRLGEDALASSHLNSPASFVFLRNFAPSRSPSFPRVQDPQHRPFESASSPFSILLIYFMVVLVGCDKPLSKNPAPAPMIPDSPADWMQQHLDVLGDRTLKQLMLPASHDSGMYLTGFPQSLGRTQDLSIYDQLCAGVRYFDLRPAYSAGRFYLHHDIIKGPSLEVVLGDVHRFMALGHRELVLLKFSHYDQFNADRYNQLNRQIQQQLNPWLFASQRSSPRLAEIPLHNYLKQSGAVLVLCDGQFPINQPAPGIHVYRDAESADVASGELRVFDQYSNTVSLESMKHDQLDKLSRYDGHCLSHRETDCDLFLLSWTLTPPTDAPAYAKTANQTLADDWNALIVPNSSGRIPNLIYVDCAGQWLTRLVISQNLHLATR